jgi:FAD/FMN-containing dehydrogenase
LNALWFNKVKQTVKVQMGAIWRDVYVFMAGTGTGLIPIGGGCPTVAPPGFMQGGGYSFVSRSYGMSIDNLVGLSIVTPDGQLRQVGEDSTSQDDKDLFWALCGGGGGNFGVVVDMTMRVHAPRSKSMLVGQIQYPLEQAEELLGFYNEWVEGLPNEMAVYGHIGQLPGEVDPSHKVKSISLTPVFNGEWAQGVELLQDVLKLNPRVAALHNMTLPDWELFNGNFTKVENRSAYIRSLIVPPRGMGAKAAKVYVKYMNSAPSAESFCVWTLLGGKVEDRAPDATAYVHRDARFVPQVKSIWNRAQPADEQPNVHWAYEFFEELAEACGATGAYVNYIDPLLHDWTRMYYGDNYPRLEAIKRKVDPGNLFCAQQSVGSSFNPPAKLTDLSPLNRTFVPKP